MRRDQEIFDLIEQEHQRQLKGMELIASENFVSDEVMNAMGSYLTNKYAEGYPGKRYYGGCQVVDKVENLFATLALLHFDASVPLPGTTSMMSPTSQFSALQMRSITFVATHSPFDIFVKVERATPETRCKSPRVMSRSINCFHSFL